MSGQLDLARSFIQTRCCEYTQGRDVCVCECVCGQGRRVGELPEGIKRGTFTEESRKKL